VRDFDVDMGRSPASSPVREDAALVCLHGLAASSRWWGAVSGGLEAGGPLHVLDLPRAVPPEELAPWVAQRLEELRPPVDLVGHSLGALVAVRVAASRPELVRRLILIAPPGIASRGSALAYGWPLVTSLLRARPRFLMRLAADAARAGPRNILRGGRYVAAADATAEAERVRAPTLLVWGADDRLVPSVAGDAWLRALPRARLHVIAGASHVPMVEAPAELVAAISTFRDER
jgi:pimeloyl-ACP methyl ester carboxylesterase